MATTAIVLPDISNETKDDNKLNVFLALLDTRVANAPGIAEMWNQLDETTVHY